MTTNFFIGAIFTILALLVVGRSIYVKNWYQLGSVLVCWALGVALMFVASAIIPTKGFAIGIYRIDDLSWQGKAWVGTMLGAVAAYINYWREPKWMTMHKANQPEVINPMVEPQAPQM